MDGAAQSRRIVRLAQGFAGAVAGPIFVKELRVDSRRARSYVLRFAYLALMTIFVAITWTLASRDSSSTTSSYQSADTGKAIVLTITVFQFVALQLIAVIVMSTSISDEVYRGTMSVLMTTPISNFQVIMGKLSSKLLHLAVLVILSVPLLSVVRVFGGVPWNYVVGASCITLTACAFAGAVTLFYSVLIRRAYMTILASLGTLFFLYIVSSILLVLVQAVMALASGFSRNPLWTTIPSYANPIWAFALMTEQLMIPGLRGMVTFVWPIHCLLMLGLTACISLLCVPMVRRVSLRRAMGGGQAPKPVRFSIPAAPAHPPMTADRLQETVTAMNNLQSSAASDHRSPVSGIRRVTGSPIVWKETRGPWVFRGVWSLVGLILCLSTLGLIDILVGILGGLRDTGYHAGVMAVLTALAVVVVSVTSATTISTEKESRSLPVLLTTPVDDGRIIMGKFVGVLRRCIGTFIPMTGHLILFVLVGLLVKDGFIRPVALGHMALVVASMLWFYISSGLYFGAKYKRTTAAVVLNLGLALVLLLLLPILIGLMSTSLDLSVLLDGNPIVQAGVMIGGDGWSWTTSTDVFFRGEDNYGWPSGSQGFWQSAVELLTWAFVYFVAGSVFLWRARANLRKNIF